MIAEWPGRVTAVVLSEDTPTVADVTVFLYSEDRQRVLVLPVPRAFAPEPGSFVVVTLAASLADAP